MDGAQMDAYYGDQLYALERAVDVLANVNYFGLTSWLKAKATWDDPPIKPEIVEHLQECLEPFFTRLDSKTETGRDE